jgi:hypothetical protein
LAFTSTFYRVGVQRPNTERPNRKDRGQKTESKRPKVLEDRMGIRHNEKDRIRKDRGTQRPKPERPNVSKPWKKDRRYRNTENAKTES